MTSCTQQRQKRTSTKTTDALQFVLLQKYQTQIIYQKPENQTQNTDFLPFTFFRFNLFSLFTHKIFQCAEN